MLESLIVMTSRVGLSTPPLNLSRLVWIGLFLVCDYLWRQEKHINRESYILLVGKYPVILLVDISCTLCSLVVDLGMLSCTPWFFVGHCEMEWLPGYMYLVPDVLPPC